MEYVQERVATLHAFSDRVPDAPTESAAVVVPLTEREHASLAAERVLTTLERVDPARVIVALRASEDHVATVTRWLDSFELAPDVLWCNAPEVRERLGEVGLNGPAGKGRDVWLALGLAAQEEYVVVHDADATTYSRAHVPRLLFPLAEGYDFSKGYYARVENDRLYGRLFRLFYTPLVRALDEGHEDDVVDYLASFRYALAGEFAATSELVRSLRAQRGWGLEIGTLGDAFEGAGFDGSAQVDLGQHEHDHRAVGGPQGLGDMCSEVATALFQVVEDAGLQPAYDRLRERYRAEADRLVRQYETDAAFNGLEFDAAGEREQVETYADAVQPPAEDTRLPAWRDTDLDPAAVRDASDEGLDRTGSR
ncbi:glycosyl transferase family 2 [Halorientalis brevis]|uniref:Glycosyl transferase family 2 n=1 Tax=Halorientalis brevis TaxID=1126241 RepID=A0ABD6C9A6_9EURY|nr:glycosyl transferase family 2 [Halorientalis brevis]